MSDLLGERKPTLHSALKAATAAAHTRLESALALLDPPLQPARFLLILQGFLGFHQVWEKLLAQHGELTEVLRGRSKLAVLQHDLAGLGMPPGAIAALPLCMEAQALDGSAMRMLGGVYVLEGSTLGGQVIGQALAGRAWLPDGGLQYFNPYGPRTGAMWRALREALDAVTAPGAQAEIIRGAQDTFALLHDWLAPLGAAGGRAA